MFCGCIYGKSYKNLSKELIISAFGKRTKSEMKNFVATKNFMTDQHLLGKYKNKQSITLVL